jgi:hypothetical protein
LANAFSRNRAVNDSLTGLAGVKILSIPAKNQSGWIQT